MSARTTTVTEKGAREALFSVTVVVLADKSVTLTWSAPTEYSDGSPLEDLAGYKIFYGPAEGDYPHEILIDNAGLTTYVVENLLPGTWYFVAKSFNSTGVESDFSNAVSKEAL